MRRGAPLAAALVSLALGCRLGTDVRESVSAPHLVVTPDSLAFHGRVGDTILPDQYVSISYDANVSGHWAASENGSWLIIPSGGDTLPFFLPVGPRPSGLAAGTYAASLWVAAAGDTLRIPVTLQLEPAASLSGRWAAEQDSVRLALDLSDSGGTVTGWGTASPPARAVVVAGTHAGPAVTLTLTASDATFQFSGSLVGSDALTGTLSGGGLAGLVLTLYRQ